MNDIPKSDFSEYKDNTKATKYPTNDVAWAGVLDCIYGIEIVRDRPYYGIFKIFNLDNKELIYVEKDVAISFDAKFGPDVLDIHEWQEKGLEIIDNSSMIR